jgi:apolipoprotein N-acyltransferase
MAASATLFAIAQPPAGVTYVSWLCLVPFLVALRVCRSTAEAILAGLAFGLLYAALTAAWLPGALAFFFRLDRFTSWLASLAVYALFVAIPCALFGALARPTLHRGSALAVGVVLPALWVSTELLQARVLGGLPWALLGHALHEETLLIQIADVGGVFGVSAVVAAVNVAVYLALCGARNVRRTFRPLALAAALVGAVATYGALRVAEVGRTAPARRVSVGVVQANLPPVHPWTTVAAERALSAYTRLTQSSFAAGTADVIVWPENAIPLRLAEDAATGAHLARLAGQVRTPLVLGASGADGAREGTRVNAAHLVVPGGGPVATYRKQRLVPFAEYRPLGHGNGAESASGAGDAATGFDAGGLRWGPSIGLDLVYPEVVRASVVAGAEALVNLSNDGWLSAGGPGAAPQQLAQAVFRAVENRRDVVRAAATGISAVVDAAGVPTAVLAEGEAGVLTAGVAARTGLTPYTRFGDVFAALCVLVAAAGTAYARRAEPAHA